MPRASRRIGYVLAVACLASIGLAGWARGRVWAQLVVPSKSTPPTATPAPNLTAVLYVPGGKRVAFAVDCTGTNASKVISATFLDGNGNAYPLTMMAGYPQILTTATNQKFVLVYATTHNPTASGGTAPPTPTPAPANPGIPTATGPGGTGQSPTISIITDTGPLVVPTAVPGPTTSIPGPCD